MKSIYILLTKSETITSRMIRLTTAAKYTHASISLEPDLSPLYSFARRFVHLPLPAGLCTESLHKGYFKRYDEIPCALYELKVSDSVWEAVRNDIEQMMADAPSYRFSVVGLIFCGLKVPVHRRNRYFCSEFVSEVLHRNNALNLSKKPSLMSPQDYSEMSELKCLYEGALRSLRTQYLLQSV